METGNINNAPTGGEKKQKIKRPRYYKNLYSKSLPSDGLYNPNTFNALDSGLAYFAVLIVFGVISVVFSLFVAFVWNVYLSDYYLLMIISSLLSQGGILLVALLYSKIRRVSVLSGGGYELKFRIKDIIMSILLVLGIVLVFSSLHSEFYSYTSYFGGTTEIDESILDNSNVFYALIYAYILVPILPAICEEMLFRGVIMRGLEQLGFLPAAILSGLMFSFMHGNFAQMILQFIAGFAIACAVMLTRNFLVGMVMHFVNNLFAMIFSVYTTMAAEISEGLSSIVGAMSIVFGIVMLAIGCIYFGKMYLFRYRKKLLNEPQAKSNEPFGKFVCFSSPSKCESESFCCTAGECREVIEKHSEALYLDRKGRFVRPNAKANIKAAYIVVFAGIFVALLSVFSTLII